MCAKSTNKRETTQREYKFYIIMEGSVVGVTGWASFGELKDRLQKSFKQTVKKFHILDRIRSPTKIHSQKSDVGLRRCKDQGTGGPALVPTFANQWRIIFVWRIIQELPLCACCDREHGWRAVVTHARIFFAKGIRSTTYIATTHKILAFRFQFVVSRVSGASGAPIYTPS